ncbi:MAG: HAD-IA family hydrolase [archaeon]
MEKETKKKVDEKKAVIDKNSYIDPKYPYFKLFHGVIELLKLLKKNKYNIALASSSQRSHIDIVLKNNKIAGMFDFVISGLDVKFSKPNPEIFQKCAERFKSEPYECVVIEDAMNGVIAAKRAGMHCIAILSSTKKELLGEADILIDSIKEINISLIKDFD